MKKTTIFLAASLLSVTGALPLIGEMPAVKQQISLEENGLKNSQELGMRAIEKIRTKYENGEYALFLKELDDAYQSALSKGELNSFIEMREDSAMDQKAWEDQARRLQERRGKELIAAVESEESSLFRDKVLSIATQITTPEQDEAIFTIAALRQMMPGSAESEEMNQLIDLDIEYEYKALHLNMMETDVQAIKEKQMVLRMDRAKKMMNLSLAFQDETCKKSVALYVQGLDQRLSQNWDGIDLNQWSYQEKAPDNSMEAKVFSILNRYREALSELAQALMGTQEKA